jgi:hypothetical protein
MTAQIALQDSIDGPMLDITSPVHGVEVDMKQDGNTIWVNVDGVCRLRINKNAQGVRVIEDNDRVIYWRAKA